MESPPYQGFLPLDALAATLGLPRTWVKNQADAGAIPSLELNGRRVFDAELVRASLRDRMRQSVVEETT